MGRAAKSQYPVGIVGLLMVATKNGDKKSHETWVIMGYPIF